MPVQKGDLEYFRTRGDADADQALIGILERLDEGERRNLMKTLGRWDPSHRLDELPQPVRDYVALPFDLPAWITDARIEQAQSAYVAKHASGGRIVLAAFSLPILYIEPEISFTLATTGQLLMHVRRRLEDTQGFVDAVMTPGSLRREGVGQRWVRKIRLTHAIIRKAMRDQTSHGLTALWGAELRQRVRGPVDDKMPLDQVELALVLQTFSWVMVDGLRKMGWPMSEAESIEHVHAWSAIGWMLGVDERLLPRGNAAVSDAESLFVLIRDDLLSHGDPLGRDTEDRNDTALSGRLLVAAWITILVQIQRERIPPNFRWWLETFPRLDEALQQLPRLLIRRLCGDEAARYLRIGHLGLLDHLACLVALALIDGRTLATGVETSSMDLFSGALL